MTDEPDNSENAKLARGLRSIGHDDIAAALEAKVNATPPPTREEADAAFVEEMKGSHKWSTEGRGLLDD